MEMILFMGIQASGKSTFYQQKFFQTHIRISLDLLNTRNKQEQMLFTCLDMQARFVVDNTNPQKKDRRYFIEMAKKKKYKIKGYFFNTSLSSAIQRNALREGKECIPIIGIKSCASKLDKPSFEEGFDELYEVNVKNKKFMIKKYNHEV